MDYRYIYPLYTENDKDLALMALTQYIENNNRIEFEVTHDGEFTQVPSIVPREYIQNIILDNYGVNIITMANALAMQDLFFGKYMNHIIKYLDLLGVKHYITYMRPSILITEKSIDKLISSNINRNTYWNSNKVWTDMSYKNDTNYNIFNPLNIFYQVDLSFVKIDNKDFIDFLAKDSAFQGDINTKTEGPININIRILPTLIPTRMLRLIKAIHKYF